MRDAIPAGALAPRHRTLRPGAIAGALWHGAGRALARINGTASAGSIHASDMEQLRRSMRD